MINMEDEDVCPMTIESTAIVGDDDLEDQVLSDDDATSEPEFSSANPKQASFNLDGPVGRGATPIIREDEEDYQPTSATAEFLRYHQKFNHCSPKRMQLLARSGVIPRRLAKCPVPVCSSCLYGKATRRPWRHKPNSLTAGESYVPTKPGEVVSVDQMKSANPGFVAHMSGFLTKRRYVCATVFVDHATDYSYAYFQKSDSAEETLEAKEAFERKCADMGVPIRHYHADNGVFASKAWRAHYDIKRQGLTFAGVGAHFQNEKAENKIRLLQSQARTRLIHASKRWPGAATANLWPYALRIANESSIEIPSLKFKDGRTPQQAFSQSRATTNPLFWQPFACPVYVLSDELQTAGGIYGKWKSRSRVGLYLGRSPMHARSVALVLNLQTGHVSPQFYLSFDPSFQTVKRTFDGMPLDIKWLNKTGFKSASTDVLASATDEQRENTPDNSHASVSFADEGSEGDSVYPSADSEGGHHTSAQANVQDTSLPTETQREHARHAPAQAQGSEEDGHPSDHADTPPTQSEEETAATPHRRPSRHRKPLQRLIEAMLATAACSASVDYSPGEIFCLSTMCLGSDQGITGDHLSLSVFAKVVDDDAEC
jgi:hypothetical protein